MDFGGLEQSRGGRGSRLAGWGRQAGGSGPAGGGSPTATEGGPVAERVREAACVVCGLGRGSAAGKRVQEGFGNEGYVRIGSLGIKKKIGRN